MKYIDVAQYWISLHPVLFGVSLTALIVIALMIYEADKVHDDFISAEDIEEE